MVYNLCSRMRRKMSRKYATIAICACALLVFLLIYQNTHRPQHVFVEDIIQVPTRKPTTLVTSPTGLITSLLKPANESIVPYNVHYVWFGRYEPMRFHQMLSVKSVYLRMRPDRIYFHCDFEPAGRWWKIIKQTVPTLRIIHRKPPTKVFGNEVIVAEHKTDVARMEILMEQGGIYLDSDVIVLKPFEPLLRYEFTMGLEYHGNPGRLNSGVIVAAKNARFLKIWYSTYRNFTKREQDFHACIIPYRLQYTYPTLIHVEEKTINYPSGKQLELIYDEQYDWSNNYAMHLWSRLHDFDHSPVDIKKMNTTFGEIARLIFYGAPTIIT